MTDPTPLVTSYGYDVNGKLRSVSQGQTRTFEYDVAGFLRREVTPEKGTVTYDDVGSYGNTIQETQGDGVVLTRTYDFAGRVKDLSANGTLYVSNLYDGLGFSGGLYPQAKLTRQIGYNPVSPTLSTATEDFTYSGTGGRVSARSMTVSGVPTSPGAVSQSWTYNALGLPASHSLPARSGDPIVTAAWTYSNGFPVSIAVSGGPTLVSGVTYQPHGGLAAWTAGNGMTTTIAADSSLLPRPASITSGGAFSSGAYSYDGAGNIRQIGSDVFGYDLHSRLTSSTVSGIPSTFTYDSLGNQTSAGAIDFATNRLSGGSYDGRGNLTRYGGKQYSWDSLSRQTAFNEGLERYLYTGSGERVAKVTYSGGSSFYTVTPCRVLDTRQATGPYGGPILSGGVGRLFRIAGQCGVPSDASGAAGNLTVTGSSAGGYLAADPESSVPAVSTQNFSPGQTRANNFSLGLSGNGSLWLYSSTDVHGILDVSGYYGFATAPTWTLAYRDEGDRLSSEYVAPSSGGFSKSKDYFYLGSTLVATRDAGTGAYRYYATDHLGTVRGVTDGSGSVVETHKYQPYGEEIGGTFGSAPLKFAAMERDLASGNDYDHARSHAPGLGRFLSPDKVGGRSKDPQTWNRYAYARDNPLKFLDPNGQDFTVAFSFSSDTNLSLKQQIAIARNFGVAYAQAGVKNITVSLGGVNVFKTPFDNRAHILGTDVKGKIEVAGSDSQLDAQKRYGHAPDVSLHLAPNDPEQRVIFATNISVHEGGHETGALPQYDLHLAFAAPGSAMETGIKPDEVSKEFRLFSPEDAEQLRLRLNGFTKFEPCAAGPESTCTQTAAPR